MDPFESLVRNAVPGGPHTGELLPNGTVSAVNIPILGNIGDVVTIVDTNTKTIVNVTQDNHDFRYGFVQREIVQIGERVYVRTIGVGNNLTFIKSVLNQYGASLAFSESTANIMRYISRSKR